MKVCELKKKTGLEYPELYEMCGANHWNDTVPEEVIEKLLGEEKEEVAVEVAEKVEAPAPIVEEKVAEPKEDSMELARLLAKYSFDEAMISIKTMHAKSPFWKFKTQIEKELNGD